MGILGFTNDKKIKAIQQENEIRLKQMQMEITENNKLYKMIYQNLSSNFILGRDSGLDEYIEKGFEGNPSVYGTIMKMSIKGGGVPYKFIKVQSNKKQVEVENKELDLLLKKPNHYQNGKEHRTNAFMYKYVTGSTITYAPKLENGNNKGKLTTDGMLFMPTQNTYVYAENWRDIPEWYTLDFNQYETYKIHKSDIWHERFPNLDMIEGAQFMGQSPLKVAVNIINSMNSGQQNLAKIYSQGHAPGIVSKKIPEGVDAGTPKEQQRHWIKNYKNAAKDAIPIFSLGEFQFTKVGSDDVANLRIIENDQHGARVIAQVFGVDPSIFGDVSASTLDNMKVAQKAMWEDRLKPDVDQYYEGFTEEIAIAYDEKIKVIPDYDGIASLQPDKSVKVVWVSKMFNDGVITGDEYLEKMDEEPTGLPEMNIRFSSFNKVPLTDVINPPEPENNTNEESDDTEEDNKKGEEKFYSDNNIKDGL